MRVGVFDSGVGGLTVVKSLLEHKLFEEIIYYGDTARVPYGIKDKNTIVRYSLEALEFFKNFDIELLIVACNTVSAHALGALREEANFPVVGVVESGVLATQNILKSPNSNILIIGTNATIGSQAYQNLLKKSGFENQTALATALFVPLVEEGITTGPIIDSTLEHYFKNIKQPDAIILGCTHFPIVSSAISSYFDNRALIIHSGEAIVEYLEKEYNLNQNFDNCELRLFASENPEALKKTAQKWLNSTSISSI